MTDPAVRQVVLVSGAPGAGKTTLARPLAAELGFALLAKDRIKETLADGLGQADTDLAWSQRLGAASMELLWALAADTPAVVLEANFWPDDPRVPDHLARLGGAVVELHCVCPVEECQRRYAVRASRHRVHVLADLPEQAFARFVQPVGVGRVITVDTSQPVQVADLAQQVRRELALSVHETSVHETSVHETSVHETSVHETSVHETSVHEPAPTAL